MNQAFNRLLQRQITRYFPQGEPEEMAGFFKSISDSYDHYEADRAMIERSMEISSSELMDAYTKIREEAEKQQAVLNTLKELIHSLQESEFLNEKSSTSKDESDVLAIAAVLKQLIDRTQEAEKNLKNSEELHRTVIQSLSEGLIITDPNDFILFANDQMKKISGYPIEEMVGNQAHKILFQPEEWDRIWEKHQSRLSGDSERYEVPMLRSNGTMFWAEVSASPYINSKGEIVGTVAAINDITMRIEAASELENVNKELRDFAYVVSHDLKAPLRAIGSLAAWIAKDYDDKFDDDGREHMRLLMGRVDRMQGLIEGILEYSKIGKVKENKQDVDLNETLATVLDMVVPPENFKLDIQRPLPTVQYDKTRIQQIFQNLISNAIKYNDKAQGEIKISQNGDDKFWHFMIADNGPGIDPKYHDKVFQIFQTLNARDSYESTGIGLSIVKKTIQTYGGEIWIESEVGQGATFHFTVPKQLIAHSQIQ